MAEKRSRLQCLRNLPLLPALGLLMSMPGDAQQPAAPAPPPSSAPVVHPLLVGYVPAYNGASLAGALIGLDLSRITHLDIAFGNPPPCSGPCTAQSDMTFGLHG